MHSRRLGVFCSHADGKIGLKPPTAGGPDTDVARHCRCSTATPGLRKTCTDAGLRRLTVAFAESMHLNSMYLIFVHSSNMELHCSHQSNLHACRPWGGGGAKDWKGGGGPRVGRDQSLSQ